MVKQKKYHGVIVPMITPFTPEGDIDLHAAERIAQHICASGACIFVLGTTGEAVSINFSSKIRLVETILKNNQNQTLTYAGIIDNCLATSMEMAKQFFELGADVFVACVPGYYPLTNDDTLKYFETLAEQIAGPLILYNIPVTTGVSIPLEVINRLSHHPKIIGLKDSDSDIERMKKAVEMWKSREDFTYLSGHTPLSAAALTAGADGIVPGAGNIAPGLFQKLYNSIINGDLEQAHQCQSRSNQIIDIFQKNKSLSESLSVLKAIMHILGFCSPKMLPPLLELTTEQIQELRESINNLNFLDGNQIP
jgi:dihydrodipicolinate synthase/N-acetylneuraminate lyase